jgi:hypothetical protein
MIHEHEHKHQDGDPYNVPRECFPSYNSGPFVIVIVTIYCNLLHSVNRQKHSRLQYGLNYRKYVVS